MRFYTEQHAYYCGVDLHSKMMYLCILSQDGEIVLHRNLKTDAKAFLAANAPYRGGLVVGVGCMFCWYWLADTCRDHGCPMAIGSCATQHCPRCGYTMPDESKSSAARLIRRLFRASKPALGDAWSSNMRVKFARMFRMLVALTRYTSSSVAPSFARLRYDPVAMFEK